MVRTERLELSRLAALEPKSSVSTNSTTSAEVKPCIQKRQAFTWRFGIWGGRWGSNPRQQESQSCALPTELRPPYCMLLAPRLPSGTPGRTRTCDHPLRRRMLYPAELRAPIHLQRRLKAFGFGKNLAILTFAVLPSDWLCSTSGANVIEVINGRQQGRSKKFSYIKELRENHGMRLCPTARSCENARPFSILSLWLTKRNDRKTDRRQSDCRQPPPADRATRRRTTPAGPARTGSGCDSGW